VLGRWVIDLLAHHIIDLKFVTVLAWLRRIGVIDHRDEFFEGVQAGRRDHGLGEKIPLEEGMREEALLDVVSLITWHNVGAAVPVA
jgi:hypothetical protein